MLASNQFCDDQCYPRFVIHCCLRELSKHNVLIVPGIPTYDPCGLPKYTNTALDFMYYSGRPKFRSHNFWFFPNPVRTIEFFEITSTYLLIIIGCYSISIPNNSQISSVVAARKGNKYTHLKLYNINKCDCI